MSALSVRHKIYRTPSYHSRWGLYLLTLAGPAAWILASKSMIIVLSVCALISFIGYVADYEEFPPASWKRLTALLFFSNLLAITALWGFDPLFIIERAAIFFGVGFAAILLYASTQDIPEAIKRRIFWCYIIGLTVGIGLLVIESLSGYEFYKFLHPRRAETLPFFEHVYNRSGLTLSLMIWPAVIGLYRITQRRWLISILPIIALVVCLFTTMSQSAQVALICGFIVYIITLILPHLMRRIVFIGLALGLLFSPWIVRGLDIAVDHFTNGQEFELAGYPQHRTEIWTFTADRIMEKPVFGWGLEAGRFMPSFGQTSAFRPHDSAIIPLHPHNSALQIWLEFGLIGVLLCCLFGLPWLSRKVAKSPVMDHAALLGLLTTGVMASLFSYGIWQTWIVATIMILPTILKFSRVTPSPNARHNDDDAY